MPLVVVGTPVVGAPVGLDMLDLDTQVVGDMPQFVEVDILVAVKDNPVGWGTLDLKVEGLKGPFRDLDKHPFVADRQVARDNHQHSAAGVLVEIDLDSEYLIVAVQGDIGLDWEHAAGEDKD